MTTKKKDRLADAQRSALWYVGRGYRLMRRNRSGSVWLEAPDGGALPIAHRVLDALLNRALVEFASKRGMDDAYKLTELGRETAAEIVAKAERLTALARERNVIR